MELVIFGLRSAELTSVPMQSYSITLSNRTFQAIFENVGKTVLANF